MIKNFAINLLELLKKFKINLISLDSTVTRGASECNPTIISNYSYGNYEDPDIENNNHNCQY
jgi:hypothetical protein